MGMGESEGDVWGWERVRGCMGVEESEGDVWGWERVRGVYGDVRE